MSLLESIRDFVVGYLTWCWALSSLTQNHH